MCMTRVIHTERYWRGFQGVMYLNVEPFGHHNRPRALPYFVEGLDLVGRKVTREPLGGDAHIINCMAEELILRS